MYRIGSAMNRQSDAFFYDVGGRIPSENLRKVLNTAGQLNLRHQQIQNGGPYEVDSGEIPKRSELRGKTHDSPLRMPANGHTFAGKWASSIQSTANAATSDENWTSSTNGGFGVGGCGVGEGGAGAGEVCADQNWLNFEREFNLKLNKPGVGVAWTRAGHMTSSFLVNNASLINASPTSNSVTPGDDVNEMTSRVGCDSVGVITPDREVVAAVTPRLAVTSERDASMTSRFMTTEHDAGTETPRLMTPLASNSCADDAMGLDVGRAEVIKQENEINDQGRVSPGAAECDHKDLKDDYAMHMMAEDDITTEDMDRLSCHMCNFVGVTKSDFKAHMTSHYSHACTMCDYACRTAGRLKHHVTEFHRQTFEDGVKPTDSTNCAPVRDAGRRKNYQCRHCSFVSVDRDQFWEHKSIHIPLERQLRCPHDCKFITDLKHHLDYHLSNHTGTKPFHCDRCEYSCVNKSMLNSHMKSHSNYYPYRCLNCSFASKYPHPMKIHEEKRGHQRMRIQDHQSKRRSDDSDSFYLHTANGHETVTDGPMAENCDRKEGTSAEKIIFKSELGAGGCGKKRRRRSDGCGGRIKRNVKAEVQQISSQSNLPPPNPAQYAMGGFMQSPNYFWPNFLPQNNWPMPFGAMIPGLGASGWLNQPNPMYKALNAAGPVISPMKSVVNDIIPASLLASRMLFSFPQNYGHDRMGSGSAVRGVNAAGGVGSKIEGKSKQEGDQTEHQSMSSACVKCSFCSFVTDTTLKVLEHTMVAHSAALAAAKVPDILLGSSGSRASGVMRGQWAGFGGRGPISQSTPHKSPKTAGSSFDSLQSSPEDLSAMKQPSKILKTAQVPERYATPAASDKHFHDAAPLAMTADSRSTKLNLSYAQNLRQEFNRALEMETSVQRAAMNSDPIAANNQGEISNSRTFDGYKESKLEADEVEDYEDDEGCQVEINEDSEMREIMEPEDLSKTSVHSGGGRGGGKGGLGVKELTPTYATDNLMKQFVVRRLESQFHVGSSSTEDDERKSDDAISPATPHSLTPPSATPPSASSPADEHSSGDKYHRHECIHCGLTFRDYRMYSIHMGYHGFVDPFMCNMCGQITVDRVDFFLHIAKKAHA